MPISGTALTSDRGWGCMVRCGQMMLAEALICNHLGREWLYDARQPDPKYLNILKMFEDKKSAPYSLHQIVQMGVTEGKAIGSWFGPNTVAQAIKKLSMFDENSNLIVHVSLDNSVIISEIRQLCLGSKSKQMEKPGKLAPRHRVHGVSNGPVETKEEKERENYSMVRRSCSWKPLLLFIPLRLGLTEINLCYIESIKQCLKFKQSVGIIGGKPNHAYYFVGYIGNDMLYMDPHTNQLVADLEIPDELGRIDDSSYHCDYLNRMSFEELDPSIALGFFCRNEADFNDWCNEVQDKIISSDKQTMFELTKERLPEWYDYYESSYAVGGAEGTSYGEYTILDTEKAYDSDDEFELL